MSESINNHVNTKKMYCANHPDRETRLRCNRCEKPICISCAVKTPTGYRCKECVRGQQKAFETAQTMDYIVAVAATLILSYIGSNIASFLGFFTIFVAPIAGTIIAEVVRWLTKRRRSRRLFQVTTAAAAIGSMPILLIQLISSFFFLSSGGGAGFMGLLPLVWQGVYTVLVTSTTYYRLSGLQLRR